MGAMNKITEASVWRSKGENMISMVRQGEQDGCSYLLNKWRNTGCEERNKGRERRIKSWTWGPAIRTEWYGFEGDAVNRETYLVKHRSDSLALKLSHRVSGIFPFWLLIIVLVFFFLASYNIRVYERTQFEHSLHGRASSSHSPPGLCAAFSFYVTKHYMAFAVVSECWG